MQMASTLDSDFRNLLSSVLYELNLRGRRFNLKPEQEKALQCLFLKRDVIGILPTGFGKSLIFQLLALLTSEVFRRRGEFKRKSTILVICPLRSLIEDQLAEVRDLGISASALPEASLYDVKNGKFTLFIHRPNVHLH